MRAKIINEAKKKPTTKAGKDKKFKKVMKEFGKGELTPYHADSSLKSKKQGGDKKAHKQALAIAFSEAGMKKESAGVGYGFGTTPKPKRAKTIRHKIDPHNPTEPEGPNNEVEEEMVHPDDKIGQSILKKMGVPSYFKSNKKGEVHQKKVNEGIDSVLTPKTDDEIEKSRTEAFYSLKKRAKEIPDYYVEYLDEKENDGKTYALQLKRSISEEERWSISVVRFDEENGVWQGTPGTWYAMTIYFYDQFGAVILEPYFRTELTIDDGSGWKVYGTKKALKHFYELKGEDILDEKVGNLFQFFFDNESDHSNDAIIDAIYGFIKDGQTYFNSVYDFKKAVYGKLDMNESLDVLKAPTQKDIFTKLRDLDDDDSTGIEKDFDEIEEGDPAMDYGDELWRVYKWGKGKDDFLRQGGSPHDEIWSYMDDEDGEWIIAVPADRDDGLSEYNTPTTFTFGDDGLLVYHTKKSIKKLMGLNEGMFDFLKSPSKDDSKERALQKLDVLKQKLEGKYKKSFDDVKNGDVGYDLNELPWTILVKGRGEKEYEDTLRKFPSLRHIDIAGETFDDYPNLEWIIARPSKEAIDYYGPNPWGNPEDPDFHFFQEFDIFYDPNEIIKKISEL